MTSERGRRPPGRADTRNSGRRAAVGDSGERQRLIKTRPRRGIRFVGTVREDGKGGEPSAAAPPAGVRGTLALPDRPSIAVLPFRILSPPGENTGDEYLGVGLTDALITRLSNVQRLVVRPTSSVLRYHGAAIDPLRVYRESGYRAATIAARGSDSVATGL